MVGKQASMVADGDGGGGCRGGWSWWLKLGLGFHESDGGDDDVPRSDWLIW